MTQHTSKEAIILLGHGSRVPGAGEGMELVADRLRASGRYGFITTCYMSRLGPHFPEAFEECVGQGAAKVSVIPYFLHTGLHLVLDIPEMMQEEAAKHPDVKLVLGQNLGYDDCLADLVARRIEDSSEMADVREMDLPSKDRYPLPPGQFEFVPAGEADSHRH